MAYRDANGRRTEREILPLGLSYSPRTLMLVGWCLLREAHRTFEVPRIEALGRGERSFSPAPGATSPEDCCAADRQWKRQAQETARSRHRGRPSFPKLATVVRSLSRPPSCSPPSPVPARPPVRRSRGLAQQPKPLRPLLREDVAVAAGQYDGNAGIPPTDLFRQFDAGLLASRHR
ncbi:WYL domain-containing protein [Sphingomonas sp. MMS24-JH45]